MAANKWLRCVFALVLGFAGGIVLTEALVPVLNDSGSIRSLRFLPVFTGFASAAFVLIREARRK